MVHERLLLLIVQNSKHITATSLEKIAKTKAMAMEIVMEMEMVNVMAVISTKSIRMGSLSMYVWIWTYCLVQQNVAQVWHLMMQK